MKEVLLFAGTTEGRELCSLLSKNNIKTTVCVATEYGFETLDNFLLKLDFDRHIVKILTGRLNCTEISSLIKNSDFSCAIDATHPFAQEASKEIYASCSSMGLEYIRLSRPTDNEDAIVEPVLFDTIEDCALYANSKTGAILVTSGSKTLLSFANRITDKSRLYVRVLPSAESLDICLSCNISPGHIIAMQGPFSEVLSKISLLTGTALIKRDALSVTLLGSGPGSLSLMTGEAIEEIKKASCIFASKRVLNVLPKELISNEYVAKVPYYRPDDVFDYLQEHPIYTKAVVCFSGDSGFYSGSKAFYESNYSWKIKTVCGISSMSYFASLLGKSWHGWNVISRHGRSISCIHSVMEHEYTFILEGSLESIHSLAEDLLKLSIADSLHIFAGYNLSYPDEMILEGAVPKLLTFSREGLYVILVQNTLLKECAKKLDAHSKENFFGIDDREFIRGAVPMTKRDIRTLILSYLRLKTDSVVYDIGCGTGAVSVEIARFCSVGNVYALDCNEEAISLTCENAKKFGLNNVHTFLGMAPSAFLDFPPPTHAFIGGAKGNLKDIVRSLLKKNPHVRIVLTAVTLETVCEIQSILKNSAGSSIADVERREVSISSIEEKMGYNMFRASNPVFIVSFTGDAK